jgi:hypothetical protein
LNNIVSVEIRVSYETLIRRYDSAKLRDNGATRQGVAQYK